MVKALEIGCQITSDSVVQNYIKKGANYEEKMYKKQKKKKKKFIIYEKLQKAILQRIFRVQR